MERIDDSVVNSKSLIWLEHRHRYQWVARLARGDVCDIACGIGYGSVVLQEHTAIDSYTGMDVSSEAVASASKHFSGPNRKFLVASATAMPSVDHSFDTIISLETLEHLANAEDGLREFRRVLRPHGLIVGSVPSEYLDRRCEEIYGNNPYHLTRFSEEFLRELLAKYFSHFAIYYSSLEIVTHVGGLHNGAPLEIEVSRVERPRTMGSLLGSFLFVASQCDLPEWERVNAYRIYCGIGVPEYEALSVLPLQRVVTESSRIVALKDEHLAEAARMLEAKDKHLAEAARMLEAKDEHLAEAARMLEAKDKHLAEAARMLEAKDERLAKVARKSGFFRKLISRLTSFKKTSHEEH